MRAGVASDSLTTAHSTGSPLCRDLDSLECGAASDAYSSLHPDTGQTKQPLQFSSDRGFVTVSADSSIANIHAVAAQVEALHSFDRVRSSTKSTATADTQLSEEIPAVLTETATASAATWRDGPSTKELSKHALLLASTADDCSYHVQLIHATPSHIPVSNASQPGMCAVPWMPQAYVGQPQHAVSGMYGVPSSACLQNFLLYSSSLA